MSEPDGFPERDPRGIEVHCNARNWERHERRHREIAGRSAWAAAVRSPQAIVHSAQGEDEFVFYLRMNFGASIGVAFMRLIVVLDAADPRRAWVKSAHATTIKPHPGEVAYGRRTTR